MTEPLAVFETGNKGLMITRVLIGISLLASIAGCFIDVTGTLAVPLVFLSGSLLCFYFLSSAYRRISVYDDRLVVVDKSQPEDSVIYFDNIHQVGFIGGSFGASNAYAGTDLGDSRMSNLIIMLKDGGREEFLASDFDHLSEVYAVIHERMNL